MEEIALKMKFSAAHSSTEVRKVLSDALLQEAKLAETRRVYFIIAISLRFLIIAMTATVTCIRLQQ